MASSSRITLNCLGCLRAASQPIASSSRIALVAPFSTSASHHYSAPTPEHATASKPPHTAAAEAPERSSSINVISRGRKSAGRGRPRMLPPFPEWMAGEATHYKRPKPGMGPNWIGDTPFPLNPAFNPPPPLRASVKAEIWQLHASDPAKWTIPALSQKFSIGKERMEAVLRLKALETEWASQKKPLQTEFQSNMDRLLGARDNKREPEATPAVRSSDNSTRGAQHEEFDESSDPSTTESIAPAMAKSKEVRRLKVAALPSGGPSLAAKGKTRTVEGKKEAEKIDGKACLVIRNVGTESYMGAGRVERNRKRAELRREVRRKSKVRGRQGRGARRAGKEGEA